ncbi:hypothetical protein BCIN_03g05400 [Botrytis cinerea B05.10]|uniref:Uncharacterized protein n=1 Tax=Botryotinia fuckeliana (strain B05.10) TaxID=332648 RepID=A0A384JDC2_BOTFB|nr:hypothetical protein BCIN_03g05400 [Botrytis cinerea B05.10]ATZ48314.1 hypothetical protein BCIN_03g05400 [Botrytis cinerea B05.10]
MSYLSSPALTSTEFRSIPISDTAVVYVYRPIFHILLYGIGFLFTSIAAIIGLRSMYIDGVSYFRLFSTILTTTRNADLDVLTSGASLGVDPLAKNIEQTKLKFGPVLGEQEISQSSVPGCGVLHIAFGLEGTFGDLKKGEQDI